ncbi:hypothetical protein KI811_17615, partial [Geobacter hydrogenophilus]|uniref:hypothetical protein n=1 Tax=Geobacter hydrogenophilus TaxID=40983 RepID=UPI001BDA835F
MSSLLREVLVLGGKVKQLMQMVGFSAFGTFFSRNLKLPKPLHHSGAAIKPSSCRVSSERDLGYKWIGRGNNSNWGIGAAKAPHSVMRAGLLDKTPGGDL